MASLPPASQPGAPTSPRRAWSATLMAFGVAVFLVATGNRSFLGSISEALGPRSPLAQVAVVALLLAGTTLLLQLVALPWVFKPAASFLLLLAATVSWFTDRYGVIVDADMVRNAFETDRVEAGELIGFGVVAHVVSWGLLPILVLARLRVRHDPLRLGLARRSLLVAALVVVGGACALADGKVLALTIKNDHTLQLRINPISPLGALVSYGMETLRAPAGPLEPVATDARRAPSDERETRRQVFVLVLGETASAAHFGLDGYERDTTPELATRNVVNYPRAWACGTSTSQSVPCLFALEGRDEFDVDDAAGRENVLDVLSRVGVGVYWRDNNSGCKGVCERVDYEHLLKLQPTPFAAVGGYFDEGLLWRLDEAIAARPGDLLVVLHQKGSHGPAYSERTPPDYKRFLPECDRTDVQSCSREELVNAYDNTMLYTDHVLGALIDQLEVLGGSADVAMLYVSDHGESLGENGVYLHGLPYWIAPEEQRHVPMVVWASDAFLARHGLQHACLAATAVADVSHDAVFHTLLGVFGVQAEVYDPTLDLLASCAQRSTVR